MQKTCTHCGDTEGNDTLAMSMLKSYHKQATRWYVTALVILAMWLVTIFGFIWYLNQYDFSSETVTVEAEQDGNGTNIVGGGDVDYGTES